MIVMISRESGCGGHEIGLRVAKKLGIAFYDKKKIAEIARERGINTNLPEFSEDFYKSEKNAIRHLLDYITTNRRELIELVNEITKNEDCVIVGRCGMHLLKESRDDLTSFYIHADEDIKLSRVMERNGVSIEAAKKSMNKIDKERKTYLEKYAGKKWADISNYNFSLDSGYLGLNGCVDTIISILNNRLVISKCFD